MRAKGAPLVIVHWIDAECMGSGWLDEEEFDKWCDEPIRAVMTVGWLVRDTDDRVVVLSTDGGEDIGGAHKIPKSWVVRIEKLIREGENAGNLSNKIGSVMGHPQPGP